MARKYSNVSKTMTLTASVTITDVQIHVDDASGLPNSFPYVIVIDYEQPGVEICLVTAAAGNILTVDRGQEDTAAQPHTLGAVIVHAATAQDLQQAADHVEATTNVHGVGAGNAVVGTGTVQTLTNKTMDGGDNDFSNIPGSAVIGPINGTVTVAQVIGDWPIDTRSTGSLNITSRTTGNLAGSRLASPVTNNMTFDASIFVAGSAVVGVAGVTTTESVVRIHRQFGANGLSGWLSVDDTQAVSLKLVRDGVERTKLRLGVDNILYVTPGSIAIGAPTTTTTEQLIDIYRMIGADQYRAFMSIDANGFLQFELRKNGTAVNRFRLGNDGNLRSELSGQPTRYLPWAMFVATQPITITNNTLIQVGVTYPAGRFTQAPRTVGTTSHWDFLVAINFQATTGCNLILNQIHNVASTASFNVDLVAVQMTAGAGAGLVAQQDLGRQETVTCHIEGCENADIPIPLPVPEETNYVLCGPCGQPIEDRQPV